MMAASTFSNTEEAPQDYWFSESTTAIAITVTTVAALSLVVLVSLALYIHCKQRKPVRQS